MEKILYAFAIVMLVAPFTSNADEISRDNLIVTGVSKTMERPNNPQWENTTFILFNDLSWLPSSCPSSNAVRISSEDPLAVSIALSALVSGKPVFARIENSLINGGYCELIQITIRSQ